MFFHARMSASVIGAFPCAAADACDLAEADGCACAGAACGAAARRRPSGRRHTNNTMGRDRYKALIEYS